jgi:hypothetical protein
MGEYATCNLASAVTSSNRRPAPVNDAAKQVQRCAGETLHIVRGITHLGCLASGPNCNCFGRDTFSSHRQRWGWRGSARRRQSSRWPMTGIDDRRVGASALIFSADHPKEDDCQMSALQLQPPPARKHLILSPRPPNLMSVRAPLQRPARRDLASLLRSRCRRRDGTHPSGARPGSHNTTVYATYGRRGGGCHRLRKFSIPILKKLVRRERRLGSNQIGALIISLTRSALANTATENPSQNLAHFLSYSESWQLGYTPSSPGPHRAVLPSLGVVNCSPPVYPPALLLISSNCSPAEDIKRFLFQGSDVIVWHSRLDRGILVGQSKEHYQ